MPDPTDLDLLQVLRIKGVAGEATVAESLCAAPDVVAARLRELTEATLVKEAHGPVAGWMLTPGGLDVHAERARALRAAAGGDVELGYETFLELNAAVKEVTSEWQERGGDPEDVLETLDELHEQAAEGLAIAAREVPRFGVYADRLAYALQRARAGDERFIDDPLLPSFHTVWFECHEDFLLTLGRTRSEERSG